jgi:hypothetical protein
MHNLSTRQQEKIRKVTYYLLWSATTNDHYVDGSTSFSLSLSTAHLLAGSGYPYPVDGRFNKFEDNIPDKETLAVPFVALCWLPIAIRILSLPFRVPVLVSNQSDTSAAAPPLVFWPFPN